MSPPLPKIHRLFSFMGCLVAGPLGCLSFFGGGLAVTIFFTPELVEKLVRDDLTTMFEEDFVGEISMEEIDLAWTGVQRIEGLELRDGDGRVVLRASLSLPPMGAFIWGDGDYGVSTLEIERGDIHIDENGTSNLSRALEPISEQGKDYRRQWNLDLGEAENFASSALRQTGSLVVEVKRLSWSAVNGAVPIGIIVKEMRLDVDVADDDAFAIRMNGLIGKLNSSVEPGSLVLRGHVDRSALFAPKETGTPGVRGALIAKQLPTALLELAGLTEESMRTSLGESFTLQLSMKPGTGNLAPFDARLHSEGLTGSASGSVISNGLLPLASVPVSAERLKGRVELKEFPEAVLAELVGYLPLEKVAGSDCRIESNGEQPLVLSIAKWEWLRNSETPSTGEVMFALPDSTIVLNEQQAIEVYGPELQFDRLGGGQFRTELTGALVADGSGTFSVKYSVENKPEAEPGSSELVLGKSLSLECPSLPVARIDAGMVLDGRLSKALGESAYISFEMGSSGEKGGPFFFELFSDRATANFEGAVIGVPTDWKEWVGAVDFTGEITGGGSELFRPLMPESVRMDWDEALDISYEGWRERAKVEGDEVRSETAAATPFGAVESGRVKSGRMTLSIPNLVYRDAGSNSKKFELSMKEVGFFADGDSESLRVDVSAELDGGGTFEKHWTFYGLTGPFGLDGHQDLQLRAEATAMPTHALDERLGTDGFFADVFGETVGFELTGGGLSSGGGRIHCDLNSERASLVLDGFREGESALIDSVATLDCVLDARTEGRLALPLLPFVESFQSIDGLPTRAEFSLSDGRVPLGGDLESLSGTVSLDLAAVEPIYTERFESFLVERAESEEGAPVPVLVDLEPIELALTAGRVEYQAVALPVRGHLASFGGQFGVGGTDLEMRVELPLRLVGQKANLVLHNMRDSFQPDLSVPIEISGAEIRELDMSVRPQWFRTVNDILKQFVPTGLGDTVRELLSDEEPEESDSSDSGATDSESSDSEEQ